MGAVARQGERKGDFLAGKYLLGECLGIGGMGEVYHAQNMSLGRNVAIKILNRDFVKNEDDVLRFLREARAAAAVRHPNVVDVLDVARDDDGTPFIVQELLVGEDLESYLRARGGRLKAEEALDILIPVSDAVAAAHARDVVHRDLKPANIFLAREGQKTVPKVLDFGACLFPTLGGLSTRELRMLIGTPHYMAPEQIVSKSDVDARTDVWALGVILYELLVGETPFEAESGSAVLQLVKTRDVPKLSDVVKGVHPEVAKLVWDCTQRDRTKRIQTGILVLERMTTVRDLLRKTRHDRIDTQPEFTLPNLDDPQPPSYKTGQLDLHVAAHVPDLALPAKGEPKKSRRLLTLSDPGHEDEKPPEKAPPSKRADVAPASAERSRDVVTVPPSSPRGRGPREMELSDSSPDMLDLRLAADPSWRSSKSPDEASPASAPSILDTRGKTASVRPPPANTLPSPRRTSGQMDAVQPSRVPSSASLPQVQMPARIPSGPMMAVQPQPRRVSGSMASVKTPAAPIAPKSPRLPSRARVTILLLVAVPALVAFGVLRFVPVVTAPLGRALRGDTTFASGVLAVVVLVTAAVLSWQALSRSRDRALMVAVIAAWAFGIVMIVQTFAASEQEAGMTPSALAAAPFFAPIAPIAGAVAFVRAAVDGWSYGEKTERILYPLLAGLLVFLALELGPLGAVLVR